MRNADDTPRDPYRLRLPDQGAGTPRLQDLARVTGETVHVGIPYDGEAICVQAVDANRPYLVEVRSIATPAPSAPAVGNFSHCRNRSPTS
jgi:hypothetical protein